MVRVAVHRAVPKAAVHPPKAVGHDSAGGALMLSDGGFRIRLGDGALLALNMLRPFTATHALIEPLVTLGIYRLR